MHTMSQIIDDTSSFSIHLMIENFIEEIFIEVTGYSQHNFMCMIWAIIIAWQGYICKL